MEAANKKGGEDAVKLHGESQQIGLLAGNSQGSCPNVYTLFIYIHIYMYNIYISYIYIYIYTPGLFLSSSQLVILAKALALTATCIIEIPRFFD